MTPTLAAYLHNINPFALHFPNWGFLPEGIRWYGLSYLLGFLMAYAIIRRVTRVGISTVKPAEVGDMIVTMAIGVVIGGRLGYVLGYDPSLLGWIDRAPYWGVLAINHGGMASHGGMLGAILAAGWYARRGARPDLAHPRAQPVRHSWAHLLDLAAFATPLGLFFGRIANFINGELYGRPCPMNFPLAVQFPQELYTWDPAKLLPLAEKVGYHYALDSQGGAAAFVAYLIAQVRAGNPQVRAALAAALPTRYPSQLFEAVLEGLMLFGVMLLVWRKPRKPLVLAGWFCLAYGVLRIVGEFFRTPDAQIADQEFALLHITRGQWLSALLSLAGAAMIALACRRHTAPMGGWRRHAEPARAGR
jgi:phosphatidylglycerol:prolipoprotein diacylglycerol transferase